MKPFAILPKGALANKPAHGAPCNRCGVCCIATLCELGEHLFKKRAGPCPALVHNSEGYACGVVQETSGEMREAALHLIGAAIGCDARFNGEWVNRNFHKLQAELDRKNMTLTQRARALWMMQKVRS